MDRKPNLDPERTLTDVGFGNYMNPTHCTLYSSHCRVAEKTLSPLVCKLLTPKRASKPMAMAAAAASSLIRRVSCRVPPLPVLSSSSSLESLSPPPPPPPPEPASPFSMDLMAVPKKKVSKYKKGLRNGPRALKPIPVIVRCKCCGRVKLPHFYCCSGDRGVGSSGSSSS